MKVDLDIKILKNPFIYIKFLLYYILFISVLGMLLGYLLLMIYSDNYVRYESTLNKNGANADLACKILACDVIIYGSGDGNYTAVDVSDPTHYVTLSEGRDYEKYVEELKGYLLLPNVNSNLEIFLDSTNGLIVIDDNFYKTGIKKMIVSSLIILFIPFTIIFVSVYIRLAKKNLVSKGHYKSELETRLQRDLTEMLHHELGAPLAVIDGGVEELYELLYPCEYTKDNKCDIGMADNKSIYNICEECSVFRKLREKDQVAIGLFRDIEFSIDRIKSVLRIISSSKHIRFSNGTVPIYSICENIINSINSFKLHKITATYQGLDLLKKYSVKRELGNGNLLNILHVLCNNAIEAYANQVEITAKLVTNDVMEIFIRDNGSGILDKDGNPVKDKNIFKYGYSYKDTEGTAKYTEGLLVRIAHYLGFDASGGKKTTRGIGLFISKETVEKVGGKLELYDTCKEGTTFRLVIPVKLTQLEEQKKTMTQ